MNEAPDISQSLLAALTDAEAKITPSSVARLEVEYPYFTVPAMLMLQNNPESVSAELRERLLRRLALIATDKDALLRMAEPTEAERAMFYPLEPLPEKVTTENAIDTFLNTYGASSPEEDALLERLIFNPVVDYSSVLETQMPAEHKAPETKQDALIDAFLEERPAESPSYVAEVAAEEEPAPAAPQQKKEPDDIPPTSMLSESLAKIFIKQGRYAKAYEIITNLSLNFPEKSIYFADQLRFLQKLIINQSYNNTAKQ